jgi:hypothetical protein
VKTELSPVKQLFFFSIISLLLLSSCGDNGGRKKFFYETASKNDLNKKAEISFSADTIDKVLEIEFHIAQPQNIPFPVHIQSKDTLRTTSLRIELLCDGKPIHLNGKKFECFNRKMSYCIPAENSNLIFHTDTFNLLQNRSVKISVPFYFFSSVAAGTKAIQVRIYQDEFFSEMHSVKKLNPKIQEMHEATNGSNLYDSIEVTYRNTITQRLLDLQLSFRINIPKIYSSTFICKKITLQNDKDWNPTGSDFTLFKSSYPDLYFETFFPGERFLMHTSRIQKSTGEWNIGDTSEIIYYSDKDILGLSILDHDNFSKDDVISKWEGSIEELKKSQNTPIKFGHITAFEAEFENTKARN